MALPEDIYPTAAITEVLLNSFLADRLSADQFAQSIVDELVEHVSMQTKLDILARIIKEEVRGDYAHLAGDLKKVFEFRDKVAHSANPTSGTALARLAARKGLQVFQNFSPAEVAEHLELVEDCKFDLETMWEEFAELPE